ncbi:aminoacyl-tRNA hydrolase [bacterium]|nr:aminoacyl-tRNA hydrolase [bacterium]
MKLLIGLGNIGDKYVFTRHNIGFMAVDKIALDSNQTFSVEKRLKSLLTKFKINGEDVILIKPTTFMNLSGEAVRAVMDYYKIKLEDILVIYDDLSLPLGKMRFRPNGSDGGHNGIKSIIQHCGKDFARLKLGIGPQPPIPAEHFVLQNFTQEQLTTVKEVVTTSKDAVEFYFENGIQKAQNKFN